MYNNNKTYIGDEVLIGGSESDVSDYFLTTHHSRKSLILQLLYIPSIAAVDARTIDVNEEVKTRVCYKLVYLSTRTQTTTLLHNLVAQP